MTQSFGNIQAVVNNTFIVNTMKHFRTIRTLVPVKRLTSPRGAVIRKNGSDRSEGSEPHSKNTRSIPPQTVADLPFVHPSTDNKHDHLIPSRPVRRSASTGCVDPSQSVADGSPRWDVDRPHLRTVTPGHQPTASGTRPGTGEPVESVAGMRAIACHRRGSTMSVLRQHAVADNEPIIPRQWDHLDQQAAREGRALRTLDAIRPRRRRHGEKRGKR